MVGSFRSPWSNSKGVMEMAKEGAKDEKKGKDHKLSGRVKAILKPRPSR
jgi:hypothetical protein